MSGGEPGWEVEWLREENALLKREDELLRQRIHLLEGVAHRQKEGVEQCRACQRDLPKEPPRRCPECDLACAGKGWEGIDAQGKARHGDVMLYEAFWAALCPAHRGE
jgi:hypothetical protein